MVWEVPKATVKTLFSTAMSPKRLYYNPRQARGRMSCVTDNEDAFRIALDLNSTRINMRIHITELVLHKCMLTARAVVSSPVLFC